MFTMHMHYIKDGEGKREGKINKKISPTTGTRQTEMWVIPRISEQVKEFFSKQLNYPLDCVSAY